MSNQAEISEDKKKSLEKIYSKIFSRFQEQYIIVFLCGGARKKGKKALRDKIRVLLENEKRKYSRQLPIKVFYPEDLLIEVLNKTKDADLLSYEQFLANNSHIIVIICESAGALVELGAFTNNEYTVDKVIAAVEKKRAKDKSFIMLGPVKYLKKKGKENVIEYGIDESEFVKKLLKNIREKYSKEEADKRINLTTIVGMHYFIQLLLYYFKVLSSKELVDMIHYVEKGKRIEIKDFNILFSAALKLLFQDGQIIKLTEQRYSLYELTKKGYRTMEKMIRNCTSSNTCDTIRIEIMYSEFYKSPHS